MSDAEAAALADQIDTLPAGGADVLGVLLTVFIILLITDILGFTKIFPFTKLGQEVEIGSTTGKPAACGGGFCFRRCRTASSRETSPYLQQHAANPVDWYPWGEEALARARAEDKPILLSVGYSACHWCHVMAHESFEDAEVAAVMNRLFVNVKVDREERPDLDQIYQAAHQMLAQRPGGWPLTLFLSPDGTPFFGGTYFPKSARYGMPAFPALCERIAAIWREKRAEIDSQNAELIDALARTNPRGSGERAAFSSDVIRGLLDTLRASFDATHGGFGGAPKFPHPTELELCLREGERRHGAPHAPADVRRRDLRPAGRRLLPLQHRRAVDASRTSRKCSTTTGRCSPCWPMPGCSPAEDVFARCARETAGWIMREMQSPEGGYYSSLDADSEHEEGKFYVWSRDEIESLLSSREYEALAARFGLNEPPNFENRHLASARHRARRSDASSSLDAARAKLFEAREKRVRPGRDEKVLVSWNALAIRGMARAGRVLGAAAVDRLGAPRARFRARSHVARRSPFRHVQGRPCAPCRLIWTTTPSCSPPCSSSFRTGIRTRISRSHVR